MSINTAEVLLRAVLLDLLTVGHSLCDFIHAAPDQNLFDDMVAMPIWKKKPTSFVVETLLIKKATLPT